jgi:hypothetical protein
MARVLPAATLRYYAIVITSEGNHADRDGKRFIVKADNLLEAFLSWERNAIPNQAALTGTRPARVLPKGYAHESRALYRAI